MEISVDTLRAQFETFIDATDNARLQSERARDYRDGKQWTEAEAAHLRARGQAPIVINRIAPKVDALLGIERSGRTDPKAYPRTPQHEQGAEAVTDALRYVEGNTNFDIVASDVFEQVIVEGYSGAAVEVEETPRGIEITVNQLDYDRIYFDPHSRRKDFSDAEYIGLVIWMDFDAAKKKFNAEIEDLAQMFDGSGTETFDDKPLWVDRKRKRLKICQHYFKHDGQWHLAFFTGDRYLVEPEISPYHDEFGEPHCPIELESAYVDREHNRYGVVKHWLDIQDEVNHRRSKALHLLSVRQTMATEGAIDDLVGMKAELAKADGHIQIRGVPGEDFQVMPTGDMASAQFNLLAEAKNEIDAVGINAALSGTEDRVMSGRALQTRQQAGLNELAPVFDQHRHFKLRIYRQIWARIKQYWNDEKWIRVTDTENAMKFVGLNRKIRKADLIQQEFGAIPIEVANDPRIHDVVSVENDVAELDMDIIVETAPDQATLQQEQFELLTQVAQAYGPDKVPFEMIIEASSLRNKTALIEKLKGDEQAQQAAMQEQQQDIALERAKQKAEIEEIIAKAQKIGAEADQKDIENELMINSPDPGLSVIV